MLLKNTRFKDTVKCGARQELYWTNDTHRLEVDDARAFVVIDDHRGNVVHVPMSNVCWIAPETTVAAPSKTRTTK